MTTPRRWLDEPGELGERELRVLRAGASQRAPEGARAALWAGIAAGLAAPAQAAAGQAADALGDAAGEVVGEALAGAAVKAPIAAAPAVAKASLLSGVAVKLGLASTGAALLVAGALATSEAPRDVAPSVPAVSARSSAPAPRLELPDPTSVDVAPSAPVPARTVAPASPRAPEPSSPRVAVADPSPAEPSPAEPAPPVTAAPEPPAAPSASSAASERVDELRQEARMVAEVRQAVRAGNGAQALRLLDEARPRFPRGVLGQEREALTIEALAQTGQRPAARDRARAFLQRSPDSPFAGRLRPLAEP